ncbi:metal-dependent hydrolase [uncultured Clostridium sp.]|uniref:metal-dependent hydrolase n=1 Tax=uncultured Clostridium sp. TaxID=59620 RepID=UPI00261B2E52|nr:metal-dependent hydrolase [uncultured Clostridium sp.]
MMGRTHTAIGILAAIPVIRYLDLPYVFITGSIIGSVAPDWDLYLGIKHRTITHSLLFLAISTIGIGLFNINMAIMWGIAYALHLLADSFTKMGVPFLYPFKKKRYGAKLIYASGAEDLFILLVAIYIISEIL